eukprot:scaffold5785_cov61-Phaeocystis_antarctica.AAC.3
MMMQDLLNAGLSRYLPLVKIVIKSGDAESFLAATEALLSPFGTRPLSASSAPRPPRAIRSRAAFVNHVVVQETALPTGWSNVISTNPLSPKRITSGQLYSVGARGTPPGTRRARDKLSAVFSCKMRTCSALFPSLATSRNAKVRPCRPTEGCQGKTRAASAGYRAAAVLVRQTCILGLSSLLPWLKIEESEHVIAGSRVSFVYSNSDSKFEESEHVHCKVLIR